MSRVRPNGVGEVLWHIIVKAVVQIVRLDVVNAAVSMQVCAGLEGGGEAAVHAMSGIFCNEDTEGNLLTWQMPPTT